MKIEVTNLLIFNNQILIHCPVCGVSAVIPKFEEDPPTAAKLIQRCRNCVVGTDEDLEVVWLDEQDAPIQIAI